jgi:hypothetical protein
MPPAAASPLRLVAAGATRAGAGAPLRPLTHHGRGRRHARRRRRGHDTDERGSRAPAWPIRHSVIRDLLVHGPARTRTRGVAALVLQVAHAAAAAARRARARVPRLQAGELHQTLGLLNQLRRRRVRGRSFLRIRRGVRIVLDDILPHGRRLQRGGGRHAVVCGEGASEPGARVPTGPSGAEQSVKPPPVFA